jgi:hypothetical protein
MLEQYGLLLIITTHNNIHSSIKAHRNFNHIIFKKAWLFKNILQLFNLACVLRITNPKLSLYAKMHTPKTLFTPCIM